MLKVANLCSPGDHPESQGEMERLKSMVPTCCLELNKDQDGGLHLLLLEAPQVVLESLGFSPELGLAWSPQASEAPPSWRGLRLD